MVNYSEFYKTKSELPDEKKKCQGFNQNCDAQSALVMDTARRFVCSKKCLLHDLPPTFKSFYEISLLNLLRAILRIFKINILLN